jgi:carboxymethylenebutenolidase
MEAFGLIEHIKDVARHFAEQEYIAVAPDLYTREGSPDPSNMDSVLQTRFAVPDTQAVADLEGALTYIKRLPDSNGKVGAIGFCSEGRYMLILGCQSTNLDAAVDFAGGFILQEQHTPQRPVSPIDMIPTLSCPLLGLCGEEDPNPSPAQAARMQEELDRIRQNVRVPDVSSCWPCVLCRLPPELSRCGGTRYVASRPSVL